MISLTNVDFAYKPQRLVLDNVSLELDKGCIHGLLGKNGVGKTTLLRLISGLVFPQSGDIKVLDFTPKKRQAAFLSQIYFLGEEFFAYKTSIDVFCKIQSPFYPKFSKEEFIQYLKDFEIEDLSVKMDKLSFGTRKKVMIAFALATNTPLLIMDEPTNALDIPAKAQFRKLVLKAMNDDKCIVISTHQVRDLHNLIDNIVILDEQEVILNATNNQITQKLFFGIKQEGNTNIIYSEDTLAGTAIVKENTQNQECDLDIELLFNAIMQHKEEITKLFNI
jgi:ABC-type multidrug transport system, ATPase component